MADRGQLGRFTRSRKDANPSRQDAPQKKQSDADQGTVVIATIAGGLNVKEMSA